MATIDPTDTTALSNLGGIFWLNDLVPLRGLEGLDEATDASIGERVLTADELRAMVIDDVDRLVVVTGQDYSCSREKATILSMPVPGSLDAATMLEAVWVGCLIKGYPENPVGSGGIGTVLPPFRCHSSSEPFATTSRHIRH